MSFVIDNKEINLSRNDYITKKVNSEVLSVLDRLSGEYENKYWNPDVPTASNNLKSMRKNIGILTHD